MTIRQLLCAMLSGDVLHDLAAWWRGDTVSSRWLRHQDKLAERVEFHGVTWKWPVRGRTWQAKRRRRVA